MCVTPTPNGLAWGEEEGGEDGEAAERVMRSQLGEGGGPSRQTRELHCTRCTVSGFCQQTAPADRRMSGTRTGQGEGAALPWRTSCMCRSSSAVMGTTLSGWGSAGVSAFHALELGGSACETGQAAEVEGVLTGRKGELGKLVDRDWDCCCLSHHAGSGSTLTSKSVRSSLQFSPRFVLGVVAVLAVGARPTLSASSGLTASPAFDMLGGWREE